MRFINEYDNEEVFENEEELKEHFLEDFVRDDGIECALEELGYDISELKWIIFTNRNITMEDIENYREEVVEHILLCSDIDSFITDDEKHIPATDFIPLETWVKWVFDDYNN